MSFNATSTADFTLFSINRIISFSKADCCFLRRFSFSHSYWVIWFSPRLWSSLPGFLLPPCVPWPPATVYGGLLPKSALGCILPDTYTGCILVYYHSTTPLSSYSFPHLRIVFVPLHKRSCRRPEGGGKCCEEERFSIIPCGLWKTLYPYWTISIEQRRIKSGY